MTNLEIKFKHCTSRVTRCVNRYLTPSSLNTSSCVNEISTIQLQNTRIMKCINGIRKRWKQLKSYIFSEKFSKTITKEDCNIIKLPDDNMSKILKESIGERPYRIATSGYSFATEGYEEPTRAFIESIDKSLGKENTGYVFPPTLDQGSIYEITAKISGLQKNKALFVTTDAFCAEYLKPENFSQNIDLKAFTQTPIYTLPTIGKYTSATANASNVIVCTGGRQIAVNEISEAIKRNNKVVLLLNMNLKNGTFNHAKNEVENAAKFFDSIRLFDLSNYSQSEKLELQSLLKDKDKINELVRIYLVNDKKSAVEAGNRAAKFIKNISTNTPQLTNISEIKDFSLQQLIELAKTPEGIALMKKANVISESTEKFVQTKYGKIRYMQLKTKNGDIISSNLIVSKQNSKQQNIFENIPQEILNSSVKEHIYQINWSTINPEVGITVTQNKSKPIIIRKIVVDGTLANSLVTNNINGIPLRYDIVKETPYIDTVSSLNRQALTGNGFMAIYKNSTRKKFSTNATNIIEDRSFMPANIAKQQYEIITESGERIPCCFEDMLFGVDYKISKKAGVKLKMAVPPTDVVSSEGEILQAGNLYMVDSNGHFYNGRPIDRIKSGEITWYADMNDPIQAQVQNNIEKAIRLEDDAKFAKKSGNIELYNKLARMAKEVTIKAERDLKDWVQKSQNKNNLEFLV